MPWRDLDRAITPRAILLVGWILFVIYAYPGYMSYDSVWQLEQARHLEPYNDWHPPMMAVVWHIADNIIAGPFPMLVLQSVAYLLGCYGILRHVVSARAAAILAALLLLMPQSIVVLAVIWKDSQMAGYLLAAIALLLSDKRHHRVFGYFFIFLATGFRYNAAAAAFPIVVLLFARHRAMVWWKRYALGTGMWLALTVLALIADVRMADKKSHVWEKGSAPVDIAGALRYADDLTDDEIRRASPGVKWVAPDHIQDAVRAHYAADANFMDVTEQPTKVFEAPKTDEEVAAVAAAWKAIVPAHLGGFFRHRLAVFMVQITSRTGGAGGIWAGFTNADWADAQLEHRARHSRTQARWISRVIKWDARFGMPVWAYLVLAAALLPLCRGRRLPFVLLCSALCHEIGLFLVAPAIDYRYSHWLIVATVLAAVVLFVERLRAGRRVVAPPDLG